MSRKDSDRSEASSTNNEGGLFSRLLDIPVINSACSLASSSYGKIKETNAVAKLGLSLAELSLSTTVKTAKFGYEIVPKPDIVNKISHALGQSVSQADAIACDGLDVFTAAFPQVMMDTDKIISSGAEKLENSNMFEAALLVGEAAIDYIQPDKPAAVLEEHAYSTPSTFSNKKVDRMIDLSRRTREAVYEGTSKAFWGVASVPWNITKSGYNLVSSTMSYIPGLSGGKPPSNVRRSDRRRVKTQPDCILSFPNPSPDKKRKRSTGASESEGGELFEMIYVERPYDSDDDPDYEPTYDSESSGTNDGSGEEAEKDLESANDSDTEQAANGKKIHQSPTNKVPCSADASREKSDHSAKSPERPDDRSIAKPVARSQTATFVSPKSKVVNEDDARANQTKCPRALVVCGKEELKAAISCKGESKSPKKSLTSPGEKTKSPGKKDRIGTKPGREESGGIDKGRIIL